MKTLTLNSVIIELFSKKDFHKHRTAPRLTEEQQLAARNNSINKELSFCAPSIEYYQSIGVQCCVYISAMP